MKLVSNIKLLLLISFLLILTASEPFSIKIADIQSFRWDADNQALVLRVGSKYFDIRFSSRCWDIESAKKLEFQSWSNRTHLSVGDAIIPMSYRWGFDSPSNCFIKNIEKIEG